MFTSDNGPHQEGGADPDFFNSSGPYRGYKRDLYEGGIRVPLIVQWPGQVNPGSISDHISAFWDIMPTVADIAGIDSVPENDGISMFPTFTGNSDKQERHEYLYWEFHERGGRQAVRQEKWKFVKYQVLNKEKTEIMLFDLSNDMAERNNVADKHPELVAHFESILQKEHIESSLFPFQKK
jgi:arylsulfatase A-like enzyme